jgi:Asp-tRNA(Asn)/Glu-tRNA(Gln) amidotransferase B subunit
MRRLAPELDFDLAEALVTSGRDRLYERTPGDRRAVANVVMNQLAAAGVDPEVVDADELGKLVEARDRIPRAAFLDALAHAGDRDFAADRYLAEGTVADVSELEPIVDEIVAAHPDEAEAFRGGKQGLLGFFVGQVMRRTEGKADAKVVNELVRKRLEG